METTAASGRPKRALKRPRVFGEDRPGEESSGLSTKAPASIYRRSCESCREAKTRCSGGQPCELCERRDNTCVYVERKRRTDLQPAEQRAKRAPAVPDGQGREAPKGGYSAGPGHASPPFALQDQAQAAMLAYQQAMVASAAQMAALVGPFQAPGGTPMFGGPGQRPADSQLPGAMPSMAASGAQAALVQQQIMQLQMQQQLQSAQGGGVTAAPTPQQFNPAAMFASLQASTAPHGMPGAPGMQPPGLPPVGSPLWNALVASLSARESQTGTQANPRPSEQHRAGGMAPPAGAPNMPEGVAGMHMHMMHAMQPMQQASSGDSRPNAQRGQMSESDVARLLAASLAKGQQ